MSLPSGALVKALPTKRLAWKGLKGASTQAYYKKLYLAGVKSLITFATWVNVINSFMTVICVTALKA
jgi:hypothetical protein